MGGCLQTKRVKPWLLPSAPYKEIKISPDIQLNASPSFKILL